MHTLYNQSKTNTQGEALQINRLLLGLLMPFLGWGLPMLTGFNAVKSTHYVSTTLFCIALAYGLFLLNRFAFYAFIKKNAYPSFRKSWLFRINYLALTILIATPLLMLWRVQIQKQSAVDLSVWTTVGFILFVVSFIQAIYFSLHQSQAQQQRMAVMAEPPAEILHVLQQQLKAHFVCNALNTLQYLINNNKSEALDYNRALGNMYRHLMESATQPVLSLADELAFAADYIYVQSFRYAQPIRLKHNIKDDALHSKYLPPLALQVVVENVLKHGKACNTPMVINFVQDEKYLIIKNPICADKGVLKGGHKISLSNLKRQYAALSHLPLYTKEGDGEYETAIPLLDEISQIVLSKAIA